MEIERRRFLKGSSLFLAGAALPGCVTAGVTNGRLPAYYADIEQRTFRWFWDNVNRKNGLVPDRWPTPSFSSIAAVGFALPAYAIGVERGWWFSRPCCQCYRAAPVTVSILIAHAGVTVRHKPARLPRTISSTVRTFLS